MSCIYRVPFLVGLFAAVAIAQTASITGRVTDPAGAIAPGVDITATAAGTGVSSKAVTGSDGYYGLPALPPGMYTLLVEKTGFAPIRQQNLQLAVQQSARLDFTLKLGAVTESIDVSSQAQLLDTEGATLGGVVSSRQVTELPLLGRNPYALALLVPGVRPSAGVNNLPVDQISTVSFNINGQRSTANEFLLDGAPNSAAAQNQPVVNATPDLVQEFKVETSNYSAEFGRAAGGVFNVITRSGTNQFHGGVYEFFRNNALNANDFFANRGGIAIAPFRYNQFGGTVGGPVWIPKVYNGHNKTFFFASIEIVRFIQGVTFSGSVPLPQQLQGDFSNARNTAGQSIVIYDPNTTVRNGSAFSRTAFSGNLIPPSRINAVARNIATYMPTPSGTGAQFTGVGNYVRNDSNVIQKNSESYKVDHYFSSKNRMFARYSFDNTPWTRAGAYGSNPASPSAGPQTFDRSNSVVEDDHTITPTFLLTMRYSFTRLTNTRTPFSPNFDLSTLGFPAGLGAQLSPASFPSITITGYNVTSSVANVITGGLLGATDNIYLANNTHALQATATKVIGPHEVRFGGEFRVIQNNTLQTGAASPGFSFAPTWTQGPNPTLSTSTAGSGVASFLLGIPGGSAAPAPALAMQTRYYGTFVQDTYKVTAKLTLSYGLRYEYETPRTERFDQFSNFNYNAVPPVKAAGLNLRGGLYFVGVGGVSREDSTPDRNNIAPRLGIAYRLNEKTVIRTGGGLFYSNNWGAGSGSNGFGSTGFTATTTIVSSVNGVNPTVSLSNPFPNGIVKPSGSGLGTATQLGQAINFYGGSVTPYSASWNFSIQRQLPWNMLLEKGYTGSRGLKLQIDNQINTLSGANLALGGALRDAVPNPFFGQITNGILSTSTVSRAQLLRPYPQFDGVNVLQSNIANSSYHALEVKTEKRYSKGLSVMLAYTWSKSIDLASGAFGGESLSSGGIQDFHNLRNEYAPSGIDQTHRVIASAVYELPFFSKQKRIAGRLLGGWQLGGIFSAYSGSPLGITQSTNNTFSQGGGQRPDWTGVSAALANPAVGKWFDTSQFTLVSTPYTYGNVARTLGGLRSKGARQLDFTMVKNTVIRERLKLQFRSELFNLTNTPQFAPPGTALGAGTFGVVSAQNNQPRVIQFAMKLSF
jgi:hypothetical protein